MAILYAILSAVTSGVTPVLLKRSAEVAKPTIINGMKFATASIALIIFMSLVKWHWWNTITSRALSIAVLTGLTGPSLAWYFYMKAMHYIDVSITHPTVQSYALISILLDALFYKVYPNGKAFLGFFLILIGIYAVLKSNTVNRGSTKKIYFALITAFLWGINVFLFKIALMDVSPLVLSTMRAFFATIFIWTYNFIVFGKNINRELKKVNILNVALAGINGDFISIYLFFSAIAIGPLYIVIPLSSTSPFFSAFFSMKHLKEKLSLVRILGIVSVVAGTIIVTLS